MTSDKLNLCYDVYEEAANFELIEKLYIAAR